MNFFREIEILLRNPRALVEEIREERALGDLCRRLFLATACFGGIYGACLGLYHPVWQILYVPVKVPLFLLAPLLLTLPALYVVNSLLGSSITLRQTLALGLVMTASTAVCLAAFAPVDALLILSVQDPEWARMGNLLLVAGAGFFGALTLRRFIAEMEPPAPDRQEPSAEEEEGSEAPAPAPTPRASSGSSAWVIWLVLYTFVAIQMAWILRPYVASRYEGPPPFVRPLASHGSVFDWAGDFLARYFNGGHRL